MIVPAPEQSLVITVPGWIDEVVASFPAALDGDDGRMELVVALSRQNVERGGGPFAAAVFAGPRLVAAGVNRVLASGFSIAHAEIVALMRAERIIAAARSAPAPGAPVPASGAWPSPFTLVVSTEPCCQCFGALIWAGVERLVCGAASADAEAAGFDEGPKPPGWQQVLEARGISVTRGLRRAEAAAVLRRYAEMGGTIYGMRSPTTSGS